MLGWGAAGAAVNVAVAWGCELSSAVPSATAPNGDALHRLGRTLRLDVHESYDEQGNLRSMSAWPASWKAGLPCRSLYRRFLYGRTEAIPLSFGLKSDLGIDDPYAALPLRPLWPGFAINTLFYAGVLWMLFAIPFARPVPGLRLPRRLGGRITRIHPLHRVRCGGCFWRFVMRLPTVFLTFILFAGGCHSYDRMLVTVQTLDGEPVPDAQG